ncbi:MAG TPA: Ig-like domain-containing protein [Kofleriaceae bacterium]|nr:Ig-like domain-containing protein [Kofleriaceae bacterium]
MNRTFACSAALLLGMFGTAAAAPRTAMKWVDESRLGKEWIGPDSSAAVSHVIYMNNCKPNGCQLSPGSDNAPLNRSSVPDASSTVSAYTGSDANWQAIVQCVKQTYADFDVQIVTERPASGNYHMAIVAGTPNQVQQQSGVLGVSPFSCGYISNSVSYTFANLEPSNVADLCWTVAQETAHSWGLDHKYDNRDPMTYLSGGPTYKRFQDAAGSCGEYSARSCQCQYNGSTAKMNSHQLIESVFGSSAPDTVAPMVNITFPMDKAQVNAGFPIKADVSDDRTVEKVEIKLDGMVIKTLTDAPFNSAAPATLGQGMHKVEVIGYDHAGNKSTATVNVQYGTVCTTDSECTTAGDVCVEGHCVAGPSMEGGLGTDCVGNEDCSTGQCGNDGDHSYCTTSCNPEQSACPSGFACLDTGGGNGLCWPSDGGGCDAGVTHNGGQGFLLFSLGLVGILIVRRRRR